LPEGLLEKVRRYIQPYMYLDKYAKIRTDQQYTVRSIYLDTDDLRFFHEKIDGIKIRKKLRIRGYNFGQGSTVFLEIKRKNDRSISKNRAPIEFNDVSSFIRTGKVTLLETSDSYRDKQSIRDGQLFYYDIIKNNLGPVVNVVYEREPYLYKFNPDLRITFDKKIRASNRTEINSLFEEEGMVPVIPGYAVLEIKTTSVQYPNWLSCLVAQLNLRHFAISKYVKGVEALNERSRRSVRKSSFVRENRKRFEQLENTAGVQL
jgi:SPX domain protein involved in polyphosphate accumulation